MEATNTLLNRLFIIYLSFPFLLSLSPSPQRGEGERVSERERESQEPKREERIGKREGRREKW